MKLENKHYKIIFITLITLIVLILSYEFYNDHRIINDNRKMKLIFDNYTYDDVVIRSKELLLNSVTLLKNSFEFAKDTSGYDGYFSINGYHAYKRIINYHIIHGSLTNKEMTKYIDSRGIIVESGKYYIKNFQNKYQESDYVGSMIEVNKYDKEHVYLNLTNYYAKDEKYIGIIEEETNIEATKKTSTITLVVEDGVLKINDLKEFEKIMQ